MIEKLIVRLIGDGSSYQRMIRDAINISRQFGMAITSIGRSVSRLGRNLTLFLTAPIIALGVASLTASVRMETMLIRLQALVGSAKKGAEQFEKIKKFSIPSPFLLQDLLNVNNRLVGFGMSADQAFDSMVRLADIAALTTNNFNRLALAYGQAFADQRVMARDINQFVNSSVPLLKLLEDTLGLTGKEIREMSSRGELTFDLLENAIRAATDAGGLFFEGTATLARTTQGKLAQFADRVFLLKAAFGDLLKEGFQPLLENALELSEKLENLDAGFRRQIISVLKLIAVVGPLVLLLGIGTVFLGHTVTLVSALSKGIVGLVAAVGKALGPIGAIVALIAGALVVAGAITTKLKSGGEKEGFKGLLDSIDLILERFITVIRIVARVFAVTLGAVFKELSVDLAQNLVLGWKMAIPGLISIMQFLVEKLNSLITGRKGPSLAGFIRVITQQVEDIAVGFKSGFEGLSDAARRIIKEEMALELIRRGSNIPGDVTSFADRTRVNIPARFDPFSTDFVPSMAISEGARDRRLMKLIEERGMVEAFNTMGREDLERESGRVSRVPKGPTPAEFLGGVGEATQKEIATVLKDSRDLLIKFLPLILEKTGVDAEAVGL